MVFKQRGEELRWLRSTSYIVKVRVRQRLGNVALHRFQLVTAVSWIVKQEDTISIFGFIPHSLLLRKEGLPGYR